MTLYMIGGVKNGKWTSQVLKFNLSNGQKSKLDDLPISLIGPNAIVIERSEKKTPVIYVSGQSTNNPLESYIFWMTDKPEKRDN